MNWLVKSLLIFIYAAVFSSSSQHGSDSSIAFVIISQPAEYDTHLAISLRQSLVQQAEHSNLTIRAFVSHIDFKEVNGAWAVFPLFKSLKNKLEGSNVDWIFILEHSTQVDLMALNEYLKKFNPTESHFIGRALYDERPTIIHHFYGYDRPKDDRFPYPDLAGGIAISRTLFEKVIEPSTETRLSDFSIDPKHELSRTFFDKTGTLLKDESRFCLLANESDCITRFVEPNYESCGVDITNKDVFFAVKTFSGYYKTRIIVVKRTWAMTAKYVEYMSDSVDHYIPTIDLGVNNTERGHCEKTLAILKHFLSHDEMTDVKWLAVVDDDTLLSVPRLYNLLSCYSSENKMVIGERYGYGFNANGLYGYAYPTGGAGMIFSRSAVEQFVSSCHCPSIDSPDDMIIGMCARSLRIPILHSSAFHQARSIDYSALYLQRLSPISFHKFEDIDPYQVYMQLLHDEGTKPASRPHTEL